MMKIQESKNLKMDIQVRINKSQQLQQEALFLPPTSPTHSPMQMSWVGISMISTSCHFHHGYNVFFIKGSKTTQPQKAATDLREVPKFTHPHEEQVGSKTTSPEPALVWTIMSTNVSRPDGKWMLWSSLILPSKRAVPCPQVSKPLEIAAAPQNTSVRL